MAQGSAHAGLYPAAGFFFLTLYFQKEGGENYLAHIHINVCILKEVHSRDAEEEGGEVVLLRWVVLNGGVVVVVLLLFSKSRRAGRCE